MPKPKTKDETRSEMEQGNLDEDVYDDVGLENLREDDEIDTWEEGFMEGAKDDGQLGKCASCGNSLLDIEDVIETKIDGEMIRFCCDPCLKKYKKERREKS